MGWASTRRLCQTISCMGIVQSTASIACCSDKAGPNLKKNESIKMYLTEASQDRLAEYMQRIGRPEYSTSYIVMDSDASKTDCVEYLHSGVLGHRIAFRLKGLTFGPDFVSGSGRLSVMDGEIVNVKFTPSLPMVKSSDQNNEAALHAAISSPTRVRSSLGNLSTAFVGKLPVDQKNPQKFSDLEIQHSPVSNDMELLLGGICCIDDCWGESGCDTEKIEKKLRQYTDDNNNLPVKVVINPPDYTSPPDENTSCIVCRWLEAGPCAKEYTAWHDAMGVFSEDAESETKKQLFFETANKMATCVRKYEYYDIYVAFL